MLYVSVTAFSYGIVDRHVAHIFALTYLPRSPAPPDNNIISIRVPTILGADLNGQLLSPQGGPAMKVVLSLQYLVKEHFKRRMLAPVLLFFLLSPFYIYYFFFF